MARYTLDFGPNNTGGSPAFLAFKDLYTLANLTPQPIIYEIGNGAYYFDYAPANDIFVIALLNGVQVSDAFGAVGISGTVGGLTGDVLEIWRLALMRIGNLNFPGSLSDVTPEAKTCNYAYPIVIESVLEEVPWKFATRRVVLSPNINLSRSGWLFVFDIPSDVAYIIGLAQGSAVISQIDQRDLYDVEANDTNDGRVLVTNTEDVELVYVSKSILVTKYPAKFIDSVAWALAKELALALKKDPTLAKMCEDELTQALGAASSTELWQSNLGEEPVSQIIRSRQ